MNCKKNNHQCSLKSPLCDDCPHASELPELPGYNKARAEAIEECAAFLDSEADRLDKKWDDFIDSGHPGPATSHAAYPRAYAERLRGLV